MNLLFGLLYSTKTFEAKRSNYLTSLQLQEQLDKMINGSFEGKTNYKEDYVGYSSKPSEQARPMTVFTQNGQTFFSDTEYRKCFPKKEKVPQTTFSELPAVANSLIYPNPEPLPQKSLKNMMHNGKFGEKAETFKPRKSNVQFGIDDEFDYTTTKSIEFKPYDNAIPPSKCRPRSSTKLHGKFESATQNRVDYSYDEEEAAKGRGQLFPGYPSLIKISMDAPNDFNTVTGTSYNNWRKDHYNREANENPVRKMDRKYSAPRDIFQPQTQNQHDFQRYENTKRTLPLRPASQKPPSAKIQNETSYSKQFPDYGPIERKLYGDQFPDNLHLPSKTEKVQANSVMRSDFKKNFQIEKRKPFKESCNTQLNDGPFQSSTEYIEKYQKSRFENMCVFPKYLAKTQVVH